MSKTYIDNAEEAYIAYWVEANENNTDQMSMGEMANLTHSTQVGIFGYCFCEDNDGNENPYTDCPKQETA